MNETTIHLIKKRMQSQRISQRLLCQGICSEFTLSYYLDGKRSPDYLTFITLLQRLSLPTNMFTTYLFHNEYAYFQQRSQLLESANHSNWKQVQTSLTALEQHSPTLNPSLTQQFLLIIKGILAIELEDDITNGIDALTQALCLTQKDFSFETVLKESNYHFDIMSNQEWCALLNLLWLLKNTRLDSVIIVLENIRYQLEQYSLNNIQQLNIYSYVTYILATCYFEKKQYGSCEALCQATIALLYKHGILGNLVNLIKYNISCKKALSKIDEAKQEQSKLDILQQIQHIFLNKSQWVLSPMLEIGNNVFSYQFIIVKRRKQMNISQVDLCNNICAIKTLRKLELGHISTNEYVLQKILERLRLPTSFTSTVITTDIHILVLHQKMIQLWLSDNIIELKDCLLYFKLNLDYSIVQNQQWLFFFQNVVDYANGIFKYDTYRKHIEAELQKYFSDLSLFQIHNYFFTPIEGLLLLQLAQSYEYENDFNKAIQILEGLSLCFKNQYMIQELVQMELIQCYKQVHTYEPILQIADSIIKNQTCINRINFLPKVATEISYAHMKLGHTSEAEKYYNISIVLN